MLQNTWVLCPTEGYGPSRPLQLASVKFEENMNVCLFSCSAVFMSSMKCKKEYECRYAFLAVALCFTLFSRDVYLCDL